MFEYVGGVRELERCTLLLERPQAMGGLSTTTEESLRSCPVCVGAKIGEQRTYGVVRRLRDVWLNEGDRMIRLPEREYPVQLLLLTRRSGLDLEEEKERVV